MHHRTLDERIQCGTSWCNKNNHVEIKKIIYEILNLEKLIENGVILNKFVVSGMTYYNTTE